MIDKAEIEHLRSRNAGQDIDCLPPKMLAEFFIRWWFDRGGVELTPGGLAELVELAQFRSPRSGRAISLTSRQAAGALSDHSKSPEALFVSLESGYRVPWVGLGVRWRLGVRAANLPKAERLLARLGAEVGIPGSTLMRPHAEAPGEVWEASAEAPLHTAAWPTAEKETLSRALVLGPLWHLRRNHYGVVSGTAVETKAPLALAEWAIVPSP
jgi:hypothetical protein